MSRRLAVLAHPAFAAAVALLVVNDHVLKQRWPGVVTGKLSDFAGVVVIAVALSVVVRPRAACVLTGLGFAALKLSPAVAGLAAPLLGGVTRTDPTDLVALAVLPLAHRLARRASGGDGGVAPQAGARRPEPAWATTLVLCASGLSATMAVTATSCEDPPAVIHVFERDGSFWARGGATEYGPDGQVDIWARSDDGATWTEATPPAELTIDSGPDDGREGPEGSDEACASDRCYRVRDGEAVEEQVDGEWVTSFSFSSEDIARMRLRSNGSCGSVAGDGFRSVVVAVADDVDGEDVVVVAMGTQGVLQRTGSGDWHRSAVLDTEPISTAGPPSVVRHGALLLGGVSFIALPLIAILGLRGRPARGALSVVLATAACLALGALLFVAMMAGGEYATSTLILIGVSVFSLAACSFLSFGPGGRRTGAPAQPPADIWPS